MNRRIEQIILKYLRYLKIPISKKYCEKLIISHPEYPSFLSITDTLEQLGIQYTLAEIELKDIDRLSFPYVLRTDAEGGELTLIQSQKDLNLNKAYINASSVIVLQVKLTSTIQDKENHKWYAQERLIKSLKKTFLITTAGLLILSSSLLSSWLYILLLFTVLAGVIVGYLLFAKDLSLTFEPVEKFCKSEGKNNCDKILNSEGSKLFGLITFSDVVIIYFIYQLILIGFLHSFQNRDNYHIFVLFVLSIMTIPFILYSFYYQFIKVKAWCRLCLLVDGILILQATIFGYIYTENMISFDNLSFISTVWPLLLLVALSSTIFLLKYNIAEFNETKWAANVANRIKYKIDVFTRLLFQGKKIDTTPFKKELLIGKKDAPIRILLASSLDCRHCKNSFEMAVNLLENYPLKINLVVRLQRSAIKNDAIPGSTYLLEYWSQKITETLDESTFTLNLLRDWYDIRDLDEFKKQYPLKKGTNKKNRIGNLATQHYRWFSETNIPWIPTFFINGYQLPKNYSIEDINRLIPSLANIFQK